MTSKLDLLEEKIHKVVEELVALRKENTKLKGECEMLKSQIALTGGESRKAARLLADYDQMKRTNEQARVRVERALERLSQMTLQQV